MSNFSLEISNASKPLAVLALALKSQVEAALSSELQTLSHAEMIAIDRGVVDCISKRPMLSCLHQYRRTFGVNFPMSDPQALIDCADFYAQLICFGSLCARLDDLKSPIQGFTATGLWSAFPQLFNLFEICITAAVGSVGKTVQDIDALIQTTVIQAVQADPSQCGLVYCYEAFLEAFNRADKQRLGAYYTPVEVVDHILDGIHAQLQHRFDFDLGLASVQTWGELSQRLAVPLPYWAKPNDVFLQFLDPALGAGVFAVRLIDHIRGVLKVHWSALGLSQQEMRTEWSAYLRGEVGQCRSYFEHGLLQRLTAFELMPIPCFIAQLQIAVMLKSDEVGFELKAHDALNFKVCNALHHNASFEHNSVPLWKQGTTVILGNPPYSGESQQSAPWHKKLLEPYKKKPGVQDKLNERNTKWLNNDYVKFIRMAQIQIEDSQLGLIGFINPNAYLDSPTFRGMRFSLWRTFDQLYVFDLHGNTRARWKHGRSIRDENIFDIRQGVCVNLWVKSQLGDERMGQCQFAQLYGMPQDKLTTVAQLTPDSIQWNTVEVDSSCEDGLYVMRPKSSIGQKYRLGFKLTEIFSVYSLGVLSKNDRVTVWPTQSEIEQVVSDFKSRSEPALRKKYGLKQDSRDWVLANAIQDLKSEDRTSQTKTILYRPFDYRWTHFTGKRGFFAYPQHRVMQHLNVSGNMALIVGRQGRVIASDEWNIAFVTKTIVDQNIFSRGGGTVFPALLIQKDGTTVSNLKEDFLADFQSKLGRSSPLEPIGLTKEIFGYIYSVLHARQYREKYRDELAVDFPRIPYPPSESAFQTLSRLGHQLIRLHVLEEPRLSPQSHLVAARDADSNQTHRITKIRPISPHAKATDTQNSWNNQVWINPKAYFDGVTERVWWHSIGGNFPAQKWLQSRLGRTLSQAEIRHYAILIESLEYTLNTMDAIDQSLTKQGFHFARSGTDVR